MGSSVILRAAAAPERFLTRGFARYLSRSAMEQRPARRHASIDLGVEIPRELHRFVDLVHTIGRGAVGDYRVPAGAKAKARLASLLASARRDRIGRAELSALLASAVPFGTTPTGELWLYVLGDSASPARDVVAMLAPSLPDAPRLVCRGAAAFAVVCSLQSSDVDKDPAVAVPIPGIAEQESVRAAFEHARTLADVLVGTDAQVRSAAKALALRPLDAAPSPRGVRAGRRTTPLALGSLVEAFVREDAPSVSALLQKHGESGDAIVREAVDLLAQALGAAGEAEAPSRHSRRRPTLLAKDLARRRAIAIRAARSALRAPRPPSPSRAELTRRIIMSIDSTKTTGESVSIQAREEAFLALGEIGDSSSSPSLLARAVTGDTTAVDMIAASGDASLGPQLLSLLGREATTRLRQYERAVVRALATLGTKEAAGMLRSMLDDNPMSSWRDGLERGALVRELVHALGVFEDASAGPSLVALLESGSQEYRAILPTAAWALGRIRYEPALATLDRLLRSPKEPATCEAIWAVGAIAEAHPETRARATSVLASLAGLEAGAEITRLTAFVKSRATKGPSRPSELRRALERALWEPAFRQEETSRRRVWALRALGDLARAGLPERTRVDLGPILSEETIRYFLTRDDHRVRAAAEEAFGAWSSDVPKTRRYYAFLVADLERYGGIEALHVALRDPFGVYRHNIATRLAEIGDIRSVRPLAEATARLFAEPPTSTYEYDDAPPRLVAFVRAIARLNRWESNDVLIEGLRSGHHQVRAVIAENAPEDERFVPELMAMLGDPRSFLRSRAEKSLASLGSRAPVNGKSSRIIEL